MATPLYPTFEKRIDDAVDRLLRKQVDPWAFFNASVHIQVTMFDGKIIKFPTGLEFSGSCRDQFWSRRHIDPFLEELVVQEISAAVDLAQKRGVDGKQLLLEVEGLLLSSCKKVFSRMAEIDQRLRGKGYPESVQRRPIDDKYNRMKEFIGIRVQAETEMWPPVSAEPGALQANPSAADSAREISNRQNPTLSNYKYHVALSFAGSERSLAEQLAKLLKTQGVDVFYDSFYADQLWGKDLAVEFDKIYRKESRYCVMFISSEYATRMWTIHERRSALARLVAERGREYILPIKVTDTELDGLSPSIGYLDANAYPVSRIAEILLNKLFGQTKEADKIFEQKPMLELVYREGESPFDLSQPGNPNIKVIQLGLKNLDGTMLSNCFVRIERVESENPSSLFNVFEHSKLAIPRAPKQLVSIGAEDIEYIPIAQLDRINFSMAGLGIELLCYSVEGHRNLDPAQSHTITIKASAERGKVVEAKYHLWLEHGDKLRLQKL